MNRAPSTRRQAGFTLLEALIALLITAFGMLGLAGIQLVMSRNAEVAKQRTEATRLGEQQIETLRGYSQLQSAAGVFAWDDLQSGSKTVTPADSNTSYTLNWTVSGTAADPMRTVTLTVQWTDRANEQNQLSMHSVIAQVDPARSARLTLPLPGNGIIKRPKDRHLNIPYPAKDIGGGKSVYSTGSFTVVFSNDSGYVVKRCDPADLETVNSESDLRNCSDTNGYIVAGYVSRTMSNWPPHLSLNPEDLANRISGELAGIECSMDDARDQASGSVLSAYKYYLCVIPVPVDGTWSGRIHLAGLHTGTDYTVCRFQYPESKYANANQRNVQPYNSVNESLDNQNYVITTGTSCPTVDGLQTVSHQVCRNSNAQRAQDCPVPPASP